MKNIKCNLCGGDDYHLLISSGDRFYKIRYPIFHIVECNICGLVYINPQPSTEELKKHYPKDYGPHQNNFILLKYNKFLSFLKKKYNSFKKNNKNKSLPQITDFSTKNFLDFGCGSGAYLEKMKRLHPNWNLYGLDNSELACQNTKEKGFRVFCGDLLGVELPSNFFDEVYMGQVIEHVNDPRKTIRKLNSIMKVDGLLTMGTPNIDSLAAKTFKSYWFALEVPRHLYLFSRKTLSGILEEEGFRVAIVKYDREPKTAIRSIDYFLGGNSVNINPILWHSLWYILSPFSIFLSIFGKTSIMTVTSRKL
jgi:2-polyprenyl-3-methyl-5-hydroxy-6-metoxy-1,4-benzoquinol methylase